MNKIRIIVADNQTLTRIGFISILSEYYNNCLFVKEVNSRGELLDTLQKATPHILMLDFETFKFDDLKDLQEIRKIYSEMGILIVSNNLQQETILRIVDYGITNFVHKSAEEYELIEAFKACIDNRKYFSSKILDILLNNKTTHRDSTFGTGQLTSTEIEIVKLIAMGNTTKTIATSRKLSYHTIITHRKNIFRKLNIKNMSELILYALRIGLVDTTEYYI